MDFILVKGRIAPLTACEKQWPPASIAVLATFVEVAMGDVLNEQPPADTETGKLSKDTKVFIVRVLTRSKAQFQSELNLTRVRAEQIARDLAKERIAQIVDRRAEICAVKEVEKVRFKPNVVPLFGDKTFEQRKVVKPVTATNLTEPRRTIQTKLTSQAVEEFISLANHCEVLCQSNRKKSGNVSPRNSSNKSPRKSRRSFRR